MNVRETAWRLNPYKRLPGGSVYYSWLGRYRTKGISPNRRRDKSAYWNEKFADTKVLNDWEVRPGPLEFVYNVVQSRQSGETKPFRIVNLGAGPGDFSIDLVHIPDVTVEHVDFSKEANRVARESVQYANAQEGRDLPLSIITSDNRAYLKSMLQKREKADMVFVYGGLGENNPSERVTKQTLHLAAKVLNPGGYLWFVGPEQPMLIDANDTRATDILGEFPPKPNIAQRALRRHNMIVVKNIAAQKEENHPFEPNGTPVRHSHVTRRTLFVKRADGIITTPNFGFSKAVGKDWDATWQRIIKPSQ